ncbi:MAG: FAD-binding protein [Planctomycetota bacterium]
MEPHSLDLTTLRVLGVPLELHEREEELLGRACKQAGLRPEEVRGYKLALRSLDARRTRGILRYVCHVDLFWNGARQSPGLQRALRSGRVRPAPAPQSLNLDQPGLQPPRHAVVVGSGPAGLFAALTLALNGAGVTLLERGASLESRHTKLVPFHRGGPLDPDTNLLFGEGGAGTYSDGKLYTRVQDALEPTILGELVACGAPPEICFDGRAHIGTDRLHRILPRLRQRLVELGVQILWETRLEGFALAENGAGRIERVHTSRGDLPCDAPLPRARPQRARHGGDPGAFGPRGRGQALPIWRAHRTSADADQRGPAGDHPQAMELGAASYNLALKAEGSEPGAHSFCKAPAARSSAASPRKGCSAPTA